ncbi:MAG TPA: 50S ribosomal protein L13 [Firmicutes bacterium]|jgi:large subunit ribosomal protein L13|nr:50S ribosomal protein L13 [Bacillota bacterium]HBK60046.1 50S ribosomal protein L13 [Bacillota bacterium]
MSATYTPKPDDIVRKWYVVDAAGKPLGRLATEVASVLKGKHKPMYTPHIDVGDHVIVVNADKVILTGNKLQTKIHYWHTGYPGGIRQMTYEKFLATRPVRVVEKAVKGMLPHTRLGRRMGMKLKVYAGPEHPHAAQKPEPLEITV